MALMSQKQVKVFRTEDVFQFNNDGVEPRAIMEYTTDGKFTNLAFHVVDGSMILAVTDDKDILLWNDVVKE